MDVYIHGLTLEEELKRKARRTTNELQSAFKLQCDAAKVMRENILKLKVSCDSFLTVIKLSSVVALTSVNLL